MLSLILLLACNPAPPSAAELSYGDSTVAATLDQLVAAEARRAHELAEQEDAVSVARVQALEERIALLELRIVDLDTTGILPAEQIGYDPRSTTLEAQDLQTAVDELYARVKAVEERAEPNMGSPGPGMFAQPARGGGPAPGGPPNGGKKGPPNGGKGGPPK